MGNDYKHTLTIFGLKDAPRHFASTLEKEIHVDKHASVEVAKQLGIESLLERLRPQVEIGSPNFHFDTATGPTLKHWPDSPRRSGESGSFSGTRAGSLGVEGKPLSGMAK